MWLTGSTSTWHYWLLACPCPFADAKTKAESQVQNSLERAVLCRVVEAHVNNNNTAKAQNENPRPIAKAICNIKLANTYIETLHIHIHINCILHLHLHSHCTCTAVHSAHEHPGAIRYVLHAHGTWRFNSQFPVLILILKFLFEQCQCPFWAWQLQMQMQMQVAVASRKSHVEHHAHMSTSTSAPV